MKSSNEELFHSVVKKLDVFYPLVKLVNSKDVLSLSDLEPFFDSILIEDILYLQHIFLESGKLRSCGNPSFIHSLRCLIWSKALFCDLTCSQISLYHDYVEDFGHSFDDYDRLLKTVPHNLRDNINFLTNKYSVIINSLDFSVGLSGLIKQLTLLSENKVLSVSVAHLLSSITQVETNIEDFFRSNSYKFYIDDLVSFVGSSDNESILLVKFFDRLDNTLTELPGKFNFIVKLYNKNLVLLDSSKDFVLNSSNPLLKLSFALLYIRSLDQVQALRMRYAEMSQFRGDFYGRQYLKLCSSLDLVGHKLSRLSKSVEIILSDSEVVLLIEKNFKK